MTQSSELARFLADHATPESWTPFAGSLGAEPTAADLASAMAAKGYQVGEGEVARFTGKVALGDGQLEDVVGGANVPASSGTGSSSVSIVDMFEMQMTMNKLSQMSEMSTSVVSASNSAISSLARGVKG